MHLKLQNLGPIETADFDIDSDLTFIYGKNNIGKSYAITIMYLALKNYAFDTPFSNNYYYSYGYDFIPMPRFEKIDDIENIHNHFEKTDIELDITKTYKDLFKKFMNAAFVRGFTESLKSSFGDISNLNNKINNKKLMITIVIDDFEFSVAEVDDRLEIVSINLPSKVVCRKTQQQHRKPKEDVDKVTMYYNSDVQFSSELQNFIGRKYRNSIISILAKIKNVYYLPASRSGLYRALNAFSQILVELSKKRSFLHQKIVLPSISEQDSDYFAKINEINLKRVNEKFNLVAKDIEKKLLKGEVFFDQQTKQILFKPLNSNIKLELLGTSSMIAEVSPIVLFLKYIIGSDEEIRKKRNSEAKPIIFIEEPEAHLHPEAQLVLMECFSGLIAQGAKLVITSHSNFIFSKLNNLIARKIIGIELVKGFQFISKENGSVVEKIIISELGLEDQNFVEISEMLYEEKLNIISDLE